VARLAAAASSSVGVSVVVGVVCSALACLVVGAPVFFGLALGG
jgi:hypothetical protein